MGRTRLRRQRALLFLPELTEQGGHLHRSQLQGPIRAGNESVEADQLELLVEDRGLLDLEDPRLHVDLLQLGGRLGLRVAGLDLVADLVEGRDVLAH